MNLALIWWMAQGAFAQQPGRWMLSLTSVAFGVALGTAIHTVNHSALAEFNRSLATVNGLADAMLVARAGLLNESLLHEIEQINHQRPFEKSSELYASPRLELNMETIDAREPSSQIMPGALILQGIDLFRVASVTPGALPDMPQDSRDTGPGLFDKDAIFMSRQHLQHIGKQLGDTLRLSYQGNIHEFRIAGHTSVTEESQGGLRAVMDLRHMQARFDFTARLSRIDLRLGADWQTSELDLALKKASGHESSQTPWLIVSTQTQQERASNLSRAYRVNLNVLALVALFTGAFLVFSAVNLTAISQRTRFALLACLGASPRQIESMLLFQGIICGFLGGVAGVAIGLMLAQALLLSVGGDLGSGYFSARAAPLTIDWPIMLLFLVGAVVVGVIAAWFPATQMAKTNPVDNLRPSSTGSVFEAKAWEWQIPFLAFLACGVLLALPPMGGLPWLAYAAIAIGLVGGIILTPWLVTLVTRLASPLFTNHAWSRPAIWLAWQRVLQCPAAASTVVAGIVASFALTIAMATMVHSLRDAVTVWLDRVLPAELYVRGPVGGMNPIQIAKLGALPLAKAEFLRIRELQLAADRGAVSIVAREFDHTDVSKTSPLKGMAKSPTPEQLRSASKPLIRIYISEAMQALYGWQLGQVVSLPFPGIAGDPVFHVSGIWRDYARQTGAVMIRLPEYQALTGDTQLNDAALYLKADDLMKDKSLRSEQAWAMTRDELQRELPELQLRSAREIRELSLKIFDRSFSVTYVLEFAALFIGLIGLGSAFSAQALARQHEFGVLRQLGQTESGILWQLAIEAMLLSVVGLLAGLVLGLLVACVLVFKVNPESFYWTMPLTIPWGNILIMAIALLLSAALAAVLSTRSIVARTAVQSVRIDN